MPRLMNIHKWAISLAMFAVVALTSTAIAKADSITFDLNTPNAGLSAFAGPYAAVTINQTSATTAIISFQAYSVYLIGSAQAVDLNFNGGPVTFSNLTFAGGCPGAGCPVGGTSFSGPVAQNVASFGSFNFTLDNTDGYTNSVTSLNFDVTCLTCNWGSAAEVLTANASGHVAAAHIFVIGSNCDGSPCSGFATDGSPVPEPATMVLLGTGLVAIAGRFRRRFRT